MRPTKAQAESFTRTLVTGMAGEAPPPFNVVGVALLGEVWTEEAPNEEVLLAIDAIDQKIDNIVSLSRSIRDELRALRSE